MMTYDHLSKNQQAVMKFLRDFMRENHYSPSLSEIGRGAGISSRSHVLYIVNGLEKRGYLRRERRASRSIVLIETHRVPFAGRFDTSVRVADLMDARAAQLSGDGHETGGT